ncbi:MAG: biopolymer transporter ExbD [Methylococcaceae bacterium]|nr:biopolymer transporter ExbD [Methylococcaceae bacterium]
MNFRPHGRYKPELNLIPLIDVLIVLLIFLVLTTTFSREAAMHISLPEAGSPAEEQPKGIELVIDKEGHYLINGHQTLNNQMETLKKALLEAAGENKDPLITISADKSAQHQYVMSALDAAGQLGFVHITFAAKAMEQP